MRLPGAEDAVVDEAKIQGYLLSPWHPLGKSKAAFFERLGYVPGAWERLAEDLRRHGREHPVAKVSISRFGQKFEVRGSLVGPFATTTELVSVWIVLRGETQPRLVTAYPGAKA